TAIPLREMADDHITYKQLITDSSGRYTTEAPASRQPAALPEPTRSRRTTRERNGREPRQAAATSTTTPTPSRTESRQDREPAPAGSPCGQRLARPQPRRPLALSRSAYDPLSSRTGARSVAPRPKSLPSRFHGGTSMLSV